MKCHFTCPSAVSMFILAMAAMAYPAAAQTFTVDGNTTVNQDLTVKGKLILPTTAVSRGGACAAGEVGLSQAGALSVCQSNGQWAAAVADSDEMGALKAEVAELRRLVCENRQHVPTCTKPSR